MLENFCTILQDSSGTNSLAMYSHLVPAAIAILIGLVAFLKDKRSLVSTQFLLFIITFCLWLFGDLITWTSSNYYLIYFSWSLLDLINIVFYIFATYFFSVLCIKKDINIWLKSFYFVMVLPAFYITINGLSVLGFNQSVCEAIENSELTSYKLVVELICAVIIIFTWLYNIIGKRNNWGTKVNISIVFLALALFLGIFSGTEYYASVTDYYEASLYGLFILPFSLLLIIFAIVSKGLFGNLRLLGAQLLIYSLSILIASQMFFLEDSNDRWLTLLTLVMAIFFSIMLSKTVKKENLARMEIERLAKDLEKANVRLKALDKEKTEFVSLASHQLRAPMTAIKGYISMIFEGDYGEVPKVMIDPIKRIFTSTQSLVQIVGDFLDVSRIELGTMKFNFTDFDLKCLVSQIVEDLKPNIEISKLEFKFEAPDEKFPLHGDETKLKQVFNNLIDNSLKYTKKGSVHVSLNKEGDRYIFKVQDTGIGMEKELIPKLFDKFTRASNANEANVIGTGLGLYVAKQMVEKHNGKIWAESEGEGKGSTFVVEIPIK